MSNQTKINPLTLTEEQRREALLPKEQLAGMRELIASDETTVTSMQLANFNRHAQALMGWIHGAKVPISPYIKEVGGQKVSCKVYDGSRLLFTVPPILQPASLEHKGATGMSTQQAFDKFKKQAETLPVIASRELTAHLLTVGVNVRKDPKVIAQWNDVLSFYDQPLLHVPGDVKKDVVDNKDDLYSDDLE